MRNAGSGPSPWRRHAALLSAVAAAALVILSMARVAATWRQLSETSDEPAHVRAGLEWLERGTYRFSAVDPPLSRLPAAVRPYLAGYRFAPPGVSPGAGRSVDELDSDDPAPLSRARAGVLPLLAVAVALVWLWARRAAGPLVALLAAALFTLDPTVLAHAGLATTDMEFTAAFLGALLAFVAWWEAPSWQAAIVAGAVFGAALASKYEALALPPCALAVALVLAWGGRRPGASFRCVLLQPAAALTTAMLVVWVAYRCSVGTLTAELDAHTLARLDTGCASAVCRALQSLSRHPVPAEGWLHGLRELEWQERMGHPSYLLGAWSLTGFRSYYLVALLVKMPLPELLLAGGGVALALQARPRGVAARVLAPAAAAVVLVAVASFGHINIGVRHVLPVFALLAPAQALALAALVRDVRSPPSSRLVARVLAAALAAWLLFESHRAHPEYLAYFNEAVGDDGDLVLLDSDLDWGQDLLQLERALRQRHIDQLHLLYFGPAVLSRHALPAVQPLERGQPVTGWVAISAMYRRSPGFEWLARYEPVARVGRSITLYFVPPSA